MQAVRTEQPCIAGLRDGRPGDTRHTDIVGSGLRRGQCYLDRQVDLGHPETGDLQAEIEGELGKFAQLLAEQTVVPVGNFGQAVVGDHEGAGLGLAQVIEADGRDFGVPKLPAGKQSPVAGDDLETGINEDRHVEAECSDTLSDLPDLFGRVPARVARIGFELVDRAVNDFDRAIDARLFLARACCV